MTDAATAAPRAVRTRFAPSPTGDLHLGGAWTALASWVVARRAGGAVVLRIEDLDTARVVPGSEEGLLADLAWLGLDWDEGPLRQSERTARYAAALDRLANAGRIYPCDCSRADIARVASAPHPGEETVYPGLCRDANRSRSMRRPPSLRMAVPAGAVSYEDGVVGVVSQDLEREVGDFVLKRGDGVFAYQLAVVVDDVEMGITDVVRGADLIGSSPRQVLLARALGAEPPRYAHVPLVTAPDGTRLEKRTPRVTVRELREAGVAAECVVGRLAFGLGLAPADVPRTAREVVDLTRGAPLRLRRASWPAPSTW